MTWSDDLETTASATLLVRVGVRLGVAHPPPSPDLPSHRSTLRVATFLHTRARARNTRIPAKLR